MSAIGTVNGKAILSHPRSVKSKFLSVMRKGSKLTLILIPTVFLGSVTQLHAAAPLANQLTTLAEPLLGTTYASAYAQNKKYLLTFSATARKLVYGFDGRVSVSIDLGDYLGLSGEGRQGWVTAWLDVGVGIDASPDPFQLLIHERSFPPNAPDDSESLFDCGLGGTVHGVAFNQFEVGTAGVNGMELEGLDLLAIAEPLTADFFCTSHGISVEFRKEAVDRFLATAMIPGVTPGMMCNLIAFRMLKEGPVTVLREELQLPFRLTTNGDDDNWGLIKDIIPEDLVLNQIGRVKIPVKVQGAGVYKMEVREPGTLGGPSPDWTWIPRVMDSVELTAGANYNFRTTVVPTCRNASLSFWLYQRDFLGLWKIVDKVDVSLGCSLTAPDRQPPYVIRFDTTAGDGSVQVVFNEAIAQSSITPKTIVLSVNGTSVPYTFSSDNAGCALNIRPTAVVPSGALVKLDILTGVQDKAGNSLAQNAGTQFTMPSYIWEGQLTLTPLEAVEGGVFAAAVKGLKYGARQISTVTFYLDTDGSSGWTPADQRVGTGIKSGTEWLTSGRAPGQAGNYLLMAKGSTIEGDEHVFTGPWLHVTEQPAVTGSALDLMSRHWDDQDGDGVMECRERIEVDVTLKNQGGVTVDAVEAVLTCNTPLVTFEQNLVSFPYFVGGESQQSPMPFVFTLNSDSDTDVSFNLRVSYRMNGTRYCQSYSFSKSLYQEGTRRADFQIVGYTVDENTALRPDNNGNGVFENGERANIRPIIRNAGNANATDVKLLLTYAIEGSTSTAVVSYGDVSANQQEEPLIGDYAVFRAYDYRIATAQFATASVEWKEQDAPQILASQFKVSLSPVAWFRATWTNSSSLVTDFGQVTPGQIIVRRCRLENYGATNLTIQSITSSSNDCQIVGISTPFALAAGQVVEVNVRMDTTGINASIGRDITIITDARTPSNYPVPGRAILRMTGTCLAQGGVSFETAFTLPEADSLPGSTRCVVAGDTDGDGTNELIVLHENIPSVSETTWLPWLEILEQQANGGFSNVWSSGELLRDAYFDEVKRLLVVDDVTGDGKADIIIGAEAVGRGSGNGRLFVLEGRSNVWTATYTSPNAGRLTELATGDLDKDGKREIIAGYMSVTTPKTGSVVVYERQTSGFSAVNTLSGFLDYYGSPYAALGGFSIGDSDGDGNNELIFGFGSPDESISSPNSRDPRLFAYESTGNNTLTQVFAGMKSRDGGGSWDYLITGRGDLDGDGRSELVTYDEATHTIRFFEVMGNNGWTNLLFSGYEMTSTAGGFPTGLHVVDVDGDGKLDVVATSEHGTGKELRIFKAFGTNSYSEVWSADFDNDVDGFAVVPAAGEQLLVVSVFDTGLFAFRKQSQLNLSLVSFDVLPGPGGLVDNAPFAFQLAMARVGGTNSIDVPIRITEEGASITNVLWSGVVTNVLSGESRVCSVTITNASRDGIRTFRAAADADGQFSETSEADNSLAAVATFEDSDVAGPQMVTWDVQENGGDGDGVIGSDEQVRLVWSMADPSGVTSTAVYLDDVLFATNTSGSMQTGPLTVGEHVVVIVSTDGDTSPTSSTNQRSFRVVAEEELTLLRDGRSVSVGDLLELGSFSQGLSTAGVSLLLRNDGGQTLYLTAATSSAPFRILSQIPCSVPPGNATVLSVVPNTDRVTNVLGSMSLYFAQPAAVATYQLHTAVELDVNRNGFADWWEYAFAGTSTLTATNDADGDGRTAWSEYVFGGDPLRPDDEGIRNVQIEKIAGVDSVTFTVLVRNSDPKLHYYVEATSDFLNWTSAEMSRMGNVWSIPAPMRIISISSSGDGLEEVKVVDPLRSQAVSSYRIRATSDL